MEGMQPNGTHTHKPSAGDEEVVLRTFHPLYATIQQFGLSRLAPCELTCYTMLLLNQDCLETCKPNCKSSLKALGITKIEALSRKTRSLLHECTRYPPRPLTLWMLVYDARNFGLANEACFCCYSSILPSITFRERAEYCFVNTVLEERTH